MNSLHSLSFSAWPFPGPQDDFANCKLSMSKFGMLAYSTNNVMTIYAEELDRYTPMLMWNPFGSSSTSQNSRITAIGWYDASCCFEVSLPVIVIASGGGNLIVFDIRSTKVIANFKRKNDYITAIRWSPYSTSTFFAGTSSGSFVRFEVNLSQIVTSSVKWEIKFSEMQVDFIAIDEIDGNRAAVSSKKGNFGVVYNINTDKPFHSADSLLLCDQSRQITNCTFFPIHRNFLIVTTDFESMLYALEEGVTVPLLNIPDIQQIKISQTLGNRAIVVRSSTVELWELQKDMSKRISSTKISSSKLSSTSEIQLVDMLDDTIVLLTSTFWLTTIELRRDKLFVSKRVKLFNSRPNDFSYANETLAFCTEDGKVLITRTSSPKFKMLMRWNQPKVTNASINQSQNNEESDKSQIKPTETSETENKSELDESKTEENEEVQKEEKKEEKKVGIEQAKPPEERQKIRRHMTLDSFPLKKPGFNFLSDDENESSDEKTDGSKEGSSSQNDTEIDNKSKTTSKKAGKRKNKSGRRFTVSDFELRTQSTESLLDFRNQKTFDPLPEDDEIVSKSVVTRRGSLIKRPSFLDEANEDGSFSNVTTKLIDGSGSFELPSTGLLLGSNSSLLTPKAESENKILETETKKQETETKKQETETKKQETEMKKQETETKKQETETKKQETETKKQETEMKKQETDTKKQETDTKKQNDSNSRLPPKSPNYSEYSFNCEADSRTVSALKKSNNNNKDPNKERHVKIPVPISKLPEKKRRLSSSMEEVNISSNLLQIARRTRLTNMKDSSFSFESPLPRETDSIPPLPYPKRSPSVETNKPSSPEKATPNTKTKNDGVSDLPFKENTTNYKDQIRTVKTQNNYGNNCSFLWSYQVSNLEFNPDKRRLNRIEWITGTRLIAWNQDSSFLVTSSSDPNLDSYLSNHASDQPVKSFVSLSSRQGIVYVIDLKLHKVVPLLKKPGMSITNVTISKNKQLFAVIVNGFIVSIFISSNKQGPYLLGSITFRNEVVVTFINDMAVMINTKTRTLTVTAPIDVRKPVLENGGNRKLKIKPSYGIIRCACGSSKGIFIGTSLGHVLKVEAVTYNVVEIVQMSASISRFRWTSASSKDSSFLVSDDYGEALMMNDDGEYVAIRGRYTNSVPISPVIVAGLPVPGHKRTTVNANASNEQNNNNGKDVSGVEDSESERDSLENDDKIEHYFIEAVSTISGTFRPKFPTVAARNPLMKPRSKWAQILSKDEPTVKDLPMYGIPLVAKLIDAERNPDYSSQQTLLLRDLIMNTPQLWHRAFRYSLLIKDNDTAKKILTSIPNNHPEFMKCLMKRALFGSAKSNLSFYTNSNSNSSLNLNFINGDIDASEVPESIESVQEAAKLMDANGFVKDAVDILLIAGLWVNACKLLIKKKLIISAISIARICADKGSEGQLFRPSGSLYIAKQESESNLVIKELADIVLSKNLMPFYAAVILCEAGFVDEVISILQEVGEPEQARMLSITE